MSPDGPDVGEELRRLGSDLTAQLTDLRVEIGGHLADTRSDVTHQVSELRRAAHASLLALVGVVAAVVLAVGSTVMIVSLS